MADSSATKLTSSTLDAAQREEADVARGRLAGQSERRSTTIWQRALSNPRVTIPGGIIVLLMLIALFANVLAPQDPLDIDSQARLQGPSSEHWFGTDEAGRDLFSRIIVGSRTSMWVAFASVVLASVVGVLFGLVGGYFGGIWETVTMRLVDVLLVFPPILLAIAVVAFLGSSVGNLIGVIALLYMTRFARVAFASVIEVRQREYVQAGKVIGASSGRIVTRYILPNILAPIFVQVSLSFGFAILIESGLSFLGLGTPPPEPSWGNTIGAGRGFMEQNAWYVFWPSLMISIAILAFNTLGDGLRDSLDPRLRR
jgi:peptide/nickel transport system permease protein